MRYALASLALIATCAAQPALAKRCAQPMYKLAASAIPARKTAPVTPRALEDRQPCTILQKWSPSPATHVQALA